jgi:hypothetical protein
MAKKATTDRKRNAKQWHFIQNSYQVTGREATLHLRSDRDGAIPVGSEHTPEFSQAFEAFKDTPAVAELENMRRRERELLDGISTLVNERTDMDTQRREALAAGGDVGRFESELGEVEEELARHHRLLSMTQKDICEAFDRALAQYARDGRRVKDRMFSSVQDEQKQILAEIEEFLSPRLDKLAIFHVRMARASSLANQLPQFESVIGSKPRPPIDAEAEQRRVVDSQAARAPIGVGEPIPA